MNQRALYLISVDADSHNAKGRVLTRKGAGQGSGSVHSGQKLFKVGISRGKVLTRFISYLTSLPNGFRVHCVAFKQQRDLTRSEDEMKEWLEAKGLRYRRFGDQNASLTEWGGASLRDFMQKLEVEHRNSTSKTRPFISFTDTDAYVGGKKIDATTRVQAPAKPLANAAFKLRSNPLRP